MYGDRLKIVMVVIAAVVMIAVMLLLLVVVTTNLTQSVEYPGQEQHWRRGWQVSQVRAI